MDWVAVVELQFNTADFLCKNKMGMYVCSSELKKVSDNYWVNIYQASSVCEPY